jgi:hypothetical protein
MSDEFYIGYEPEMPAGLVMPVRLAAVALAVGASLLALGLLFVQRAPSDGVFEFGRLRVFDGRIVERPYPMLRTEDGGRYWLAGPGKRGAAALVEGLDGRSARVRGTLIQRGEDRMIQIEAGSVTPREAPSDRATAGLDSTLRAGPLASLEGEIVDSKCHLGVMKPGEGPTHRDCAVRCLLGGVPPMLVVRQGAGVRRLPLVAPDGSPLAWDPEPLTARYVRIAGRLFTRHGEEYLGAAISDVTVWPEPPQIDALR